MKLLRALRGWLDRPPLPPSDRRENRMDRALRYISGAGMAMTLLTTFIAIELAKRGAVWPLLYVALAALGIIAIVVTTYAFVLGRTGLRVSATRDGLEISDQGGAA